jgi:CheY-like chemotaxis protein
MADILVVDDEAAVRWVLADALRRSGHDCREAGDGVAALAAFREREPDLVLCDMMMPRLDGLGFLRQVTAPGRLRPPVVFLTSRDDSEVMETARGNGAFDYLVKPCEEALLRTIVDRALARGPSPAPELPPEPAPQASAPPPVVVEQLQPPARAYVVPVPQPRADEARAPAPSNGHGHVGWRGVLRRVFGPRT